MNELSRIEATGEVQAFKPQEALVRSAQADAIIDYAKKIRDWPMLENAIDQKMADQAEFVRWEEKVTARHRPGRGGAELNADRRLIKMSDAEAATGIKQQQVSKWRNRLKDSEKYRAMLFGTAYQKAMAETNNTTATKWTGDPESYTPAKYIEAARLVMGGIDLDPASNELAQKTVKANTWYGVEDDGLEQAWSGRVFLNPPYAFPLISYFIEKLLTEEIEQAVLLTNNNTDTKWWHQAAVHSSGICFTAGRINFYKADGSITQPTNGQNFFYMGENSAKFKEVFADFGLVL